MNKEWETNPTGRVLYAQRCRHSVLPVDMNLSTNRCLTDSRSEAIAIPLQWAEDTKRNLLDNGVPRNTLSYNNLK